MIQQISSNIREQSYSSVSLRRIKQIKKFANVIRANASIAQCIMDLGLIIRHTEKKVDGNKNLLAALKLIITECKNISRFSISTDADIEPWEVEDTHIENSLADDIIIKCTESLDKNNLEHLALSSKTCSALAIKRVSSFPWPKLTHLTVELPTNATEIAQLVSRCPSLCVLRYITSEDSLWFEAFDDSILQALIDHCPSLHTLSVSGDDNYKFDASEEKLIEFIQKKGAQLEELNLICNKHHPLGNQVLQTIRYYAQNIKCLSLESCGDIDDIEDVIELLNTCGKLTELRLHCFKVPIEELHNNLAKIPEAELQVTDDYKDKSWYEASLRIAGQVEGKLEHREVDLCISSCNNTEYDEI